jgi:hypothetical protein
MSLSRRELLNDASILGLLAAMVPELSAARAQAPQMANTRASTDEAPHDSFSFWDGFFDSVNPTLRRPGQMAARRGATDQLPDPGVETQYLHYKSDDKTLRYATDITEQELLDHDGDVAVGISLSQYRPAVGSTAPNEHAAQLRLDTTQVYPFRNLLSPLAWSSIASVVSDKSNFISLDRLGLKSDTASAGTSKILLTKGTGKLAVNISKAPQTSMFVKALNVIQQGLKTAAPLVSLPAISVPALSAFTQAMSYWEDRTKFIMAGNLTSAVASRQAMNDPNHTAPTVGLVSGDYLMFAKQHADTLAKEMGNLDLVQGYLVRKDADTNLPLQNRAMSAVPDVSYFSIRVSVTPLGSSSAAA